MQTQMQPRRTLGPDERIQVYIDVELYNHILDSHALPRERNWHTIDRVLRLGKKVLESAEEKAAA